MKLLGIEFTNPFASQVEIKEPPLNDVAWSEDAILQMGKVTKYNPDKLIGRKGSAIYREMMIDEQVKAVTKFKRDAITSRDYFFEVNTNELSEEEVKKRINICDAILDQMTGAPVDGFNSVMTVVWQGVSFTEKVFQHIEVSGLTYWGLKSLKLKPFDTFEFNVDDFGNVESVVQNINGRSQEIDITKFIHHVQNPEYDAQYGQSDLREAYRSWFSKANAIRFYNMFLERSASGFKWINTDHSSNTPQHTALQKVLTNTVNGAGMLLGKNDVFNIEFPSGNGEAFTKAIDKHDLGIARALLVPNLLGITPAGQTGSFSQSDTQLEAFLWTLDQEAKRLEEVLNEQLFRQLGELNFGDEFWPRLRFQPISERRKNVIIALWKDLVTARAVTPTETDEAHIRTLMDFPEKDDSEELNNGDTTDNVDGDDKGGADSVDDSDDSGDSVSDAEVPVDETIMGAAVALYKKNTFTKAMQRVDFAVIKNATEMMEKNKAEDITSHLYTMFQDVVFQTKELYAKDELEENMDKIKFSKKDNTKLQRLVNSAIQDFWKIGQRHAENEIDKAKGLAFSMKADRKRITFISEDFFKTKSFKAAGKLSDDAIAIISQVIANGVKGGKTFKTIEEDIYLSVGAKGFMEFEDYREALGSAIDPNIKNTQARIDTMLRTNGFEAVNEARFTYFTDPQLDGFVEALEYSAIMDSRTTQICQHLDGHTHGTGSEEWMTNRPPNHFNCRSLLIPVTQIDSWTESEAPTVEPQEGFA